VIHITAGLIHGLKRFNKDFFEIFMANEWKKSSGTNTAEKVGGH